MVCLDDAEEKLKWKVLIDVDFPQKRTLTVRSLLPFFQVAAAISKRPPVKTEKGNNKYWGNIFMVMID